LTFLHPASVSSLEALDAIDCKSAKSGEGKERAIDAPYLGFLDLVMVRKAQFNDLVGQQTMDAILDGPLRLTGT
jgi:hypothetical protein